MKIGSLFSGYGGLDMAVGGELAWYSEIEPAACKVMEANHAGVPNLGDITQIDWSDVPRVDVLTGGYPCQPFSHAGLRKGTKDERHLWPYVRDAIRAMEPRIVVLENVRGHLSLGFADVLGDLASLGMSARWGIVRAADAGAPHNRARLFIVATFDSRHDARGSEFWKQSTLTSIRSAQSGASSGATADRESDIRDGGSLRHDIIHVSKSGTLEVQTRGNDRDLISDSDCERYGSWKGSTEVARVDSQDAAGSWERERPRQESGTGSTINFGQYQPAIDRWERVIGRPAPAPTIRRNDRDRLSPVFVEWMMGLPEGWVTGHGLSTGAELKMLGNGVVPQQAALALRLLEAA